jgi:3-oxoacyl-[acyl-carrier-protein] synthase-3
MKINRRKIMNKIPEFNYPLPLKITGIGRYLPCRLVPSSEIEERCDLESGWCEHKQGIKERRWVEGETVTFMGAEAAKEAVEDAGLQLDDIDLIVNASNSFDLGIPEQGAQFQRELGLGDSGIPCISLNAGCLNFLMALKLSASLLATGRYKNILIISVLLASADLDFENVKVATMLGDASGAVVVSRTPEGEQSGVHATHMETYSEPINISGFHGDINNKVMFNKDISAGDLQFDFDPRGMQSTGMKYNQKFMAKLWPMSNRDAISFVIPNQTSRFILDMMKFVYPAEKIVGVLDRFGNCGAVGYPLGLYKIAKEEERLKRGDKILLTGMGGGFSLCGVVLTY